MCSWTLIEPFLKRHLVGDAGGHARGGMGCTTSHVSG
jgi:hypothetical protein